MEQTDPQTLPEHWHKSFLTLFESLKEALLLVDPKGVICLANEEAEQLFGYKKEALIEMLLEDLVSRSPLHKHHILGNYFTQQPHAHLVGREQRLFFQNKNGTAFPVNIDLTPLKDHKGYKLALIRDISERLDSEHALRNSEEMFRQLAENIDDVFWLISSDFKKVIYISQAYEHIWEKSCDSMYKAPMSCLDSIHPEDKETALNYLKKSAEGDLNNIPYSEYRIIMPDGSTKWIRERCFAIRNNQGQIYRIAGIASDITERKLADTALRESKERFSLFMDYLPAIVFIKDDESRTLYVNKYMEDVLGAKDWIGKTAVELFPKEIGEAMTEDDKKALAKGYQMIVETVPDKYGTNHIYQTHKFSIERPGKLPLLGGIALDITERKKAEEQLLQAATVFENVADGIIITDAQGAIVTINHATTEIIGYIEEEILGNNPSIWKSDRHTSSFYKAMWASLEQKDQWQGEIWNRRKNGEIFPCWQTIDAVRDGDTGEITHYISVMSDISAIKESQERLQHQAHHDPLTNLPNRLLFNARLEHALVRAHREKCKIGVMFLDLDNFKSINDGLGHPVGDKVLELVAERMSAQIRKDDTVARIAGDEFAVILEEINDSQGVSHVAGKILSAFEEPFQIDEHELHVTMSIGISQYPDDGKDVTTLVKNADAAMYRSKERGKNRYCFYTLDLTEAALERLQLENDLRVALKKNELRVYYQPQYSLATGRLTGAEALVRWQHPRIGLVSPIKFIPLAESTGLIIPIGEWVLRGACAQTKAWRDAGLDIGRIGVNVAGQQIQRGDIVETVRKVLEETGLDPQCLELEITESFIMEQADKAINTLDELQNLGVALAIDDFGTGYSSLSYLKRLPIDKLKIDRSFIKDIPHDTDGEAIAKAVIALGKSLQLKIIAEGVETEEQKEFVRLEGCEEVQGYFYSRPVPNQELEDMLLTQSPNQNQ